MTVQSDHVAENTDRWMIHSDHLLYKRNQLLLEIMHSVKEGNEFQVQKKFAERNTLARPEILSDAHQEMCYEMIGMEYAVYHMMCIDQTVHVRCGMIHADFLKKIENTKNEVECMEVTGNTLQEYCMLNSDTRLRKYSALTRKIVLSVDMDLTKPLTLQYFAESLSVNSSYLSDLFKKEVGVTITDYVTEKRITHAKKLLVSTQNPIKSIAKVTGIPDVQYFSKIFKRRTGKTPTQYRKEHGM